MNWPSSGIANPCLFTPQGGSPGSEPSRVSLGSMITSSWTDFPTTVFRKDQTPLQKISISLSTSTKKKWSQNSNKSDKKTQTTPFLSSQKDFSRWTLILRTWSPIKEFARNTRPSCSSIALMTSVTSGKQEKVSGKSRAWRIDQTSFYWVQEASAWVQTLDSSAVKIRRLLSISSTTRHLTCSPTPSTLFRQPRLWLTWEFWGLKQADSSEPKFLRTTITWEENLKRTEEKCSVTPAPFFPFLSVMK